MKTRFTGQVRGCAFIMALAVWCQPLHGIASQGSSNNSNASSGNSNASSHDSADSSNDTANSSKSDSSKNSNSSNSTGAVVGISVLVLLLGLSALATWGTVRAASPAGGQAQALQRLQDYLQRNHALVVRDVMHGEGEVLLTWNSELGLTADETRSLRTELRRASIQKRLLRALGGETLTTGAAQAFANAYSQALVAALPENRPHSILQAKLGI